jgi:hypothetical protein
MTGSLSTTEDTEDTASHLQYNRLNLRVLRGEQLAVSLGHFDRETTS